MRLSMLWRRKQGVLLCLLVPIITVAVMQVYKTQSYTIRTEPPWKMSFIDNRKNLVKTSPVRDHVNANKLTKRKLTPSKFHVNISKECSPLADPSSIRTPFKFFIYDLPSKFNTDIRVKMSTHKEYAFCYNLNYCGTGEELYQYQRKQLYQNKGKESISAYNQSYISSVRNSHMFSLEVVIHHKLMHSPYRTLDPSKADIFYIPAYTGLTCLSNYDGANTFIHELFAYLRANVSYYLSGKPHFSTLGKIQREQGSEHCATLRHPDSANVTYIAIEKESQTHWFLNTIYGKSVIVAPYPSYIHFIPKISNTVMEEYKPNISDLINNTNFHLNVPSLAERNIKLLLACSTRRSNLFRAKLIDQFQYQTSDSYEYFFRNKSTNDKDTIRNILLKTPECSNSHRITTIPWMYHSVFCLQPPGDSPTRKSFFDSILSGCIPVIFSLKYKTEYPFEQWIDYSKFTVILEEKLISKYQQEVLDIVEGIPQHKVEMMHENLLKVAQWFQYSMTDGNIQQDNDAVTLILEQLRDMYKL